MQCDRSVAVNQAEDSIGDLDRQAHMYIGLIPRSSSLQLDCSRQWISLVSSSCRRDITIKLKVLTPPATARIISSNEKDWSTVRPGKWVCCSSTQDLLNDKDKVSTTRHQRQGTRNKASTTRTQGLIDRTTRQVSLLFVNTRSQRQGQGF